jgi:hypothetical protein
MATIQRPPRAEKQAGVLGPLGKGFDYLTLDPSPRLRKLRDQQLSTDPVAMIRQAWVTVRNAMATALQTARESRSRTQ